MEKAVYMFEDENYKYNKTKYYIDYTKRKENSCYHIIFDLEEKTVINFITRDNLNVSLGISKENIKTINDITQNKKFIPSEPFELNVRELKAICMQLQELKW